MQDIILETRDLCKSFKHQPAVSKVSLAIPRNSIYGLLGPNGAGKSTTLKMIAGMLRPDSGSIRIHGHEWTRKALSRIGVLIEAPPLYENLTARENLKFTVKPSGIREIDDVLASLDQMKEALHTSLKQQWELERSRREQISALAHDIKTPLTVIRGNAELLKKTTQNESQQEYNGYILRSAGDIEAFVQEVIDLSSLQASPVPQQSFVSTAEFIEELELQMKALSSGKNLHPSVRKESLPEFLFIHKELFQRGIANVLSNAAEHTPQQGSITLQVRGDDDAVHFTVTDTGSGFSPADLKEAATQFYRGDQSRSSGKHHGMGLYIAKSAAQLHGGSLTLDNVSPSGGGKVTISIPVPKGQWL